MIELKTRYAKRDLGPMIKMLTEAIGCNEEDGDPSGLLPRQREVLAAYEAMYAMGDAANYRENAVSEEEPPSSSGPGVNHGHTPPRKLASEGAINYMLKLLKARNMSLADAKLTEDHITPGHFRYLSARDCYDITENLKTIPAPEPTMTDGQRDLLAKLMTESGVPEQVATEAWAKLQPKTTQDDASKMIDRAIAAAKARPFTPKGAPREGFYECGDLVIKVQKGTTTSNIYAKTLQIIEGIGHEWEYQGSAAAFFKKLSGAKPLSKERALEVGADLSLYGRCFCCGRKLTDEESIAIGIGRICREKHGWM